MESREKADLVRQMTQTAGWRILKDRLLEQCEHSKTALQNHLRKATTEDFMKAVKLQERLDSVDFVLREADKLCAKEKDQPDPSY